MNRYRIMNRVTKEWWEGEASSAHSACQLAGWLVGDCWVRQFVPPHPDSSRPGGLHSGGWKNPTDSFELGNSKGVR